MFAEQVSETILFNYFDVFRQTKPLAQTTNKFRVLFDRDDLFGDACECGGDDPVARTDLVDRIGWSDRTHANQPPDQLRTSQEVLRQVNSIVVSCFHVSPPENCGETKTRSCVEGQGSTAKGRELKRFLTLVHGT